MWCSHCKSETSATGSLTSAGAACAKCGQRLVGGRSSENTIRQARDIIAKWSSSDLLDQISALPPIPPMPGPHFSASAIAETGPVEPEQSVHETEPDESAVELSKSVPVPDLNETTDEPTTEIEEDGPLEPVSEVSEDVNDDSVMEVDDSVMEVDDEDVAIDVTEDDLLAEELPQSEFDPEVAHKETLIEPEAEVEAQQEPTAEERVVVEAVAEIPESTAKANHDEASDDSQPTYVPLPVALAARAALKQKEAQQPPVEPAVEPTVEAESTVEQTVETKAISAESTADSDLEIVVAATNAAKPAAKAQTDTPISRPRANQSRAAQLRPTRERKHPAEAEHKGSKPVSRKFRVDTPGGESQEAPEEAQANVAGGRIQSNSPTGGRRHRIDDGTPLGETLSTGDSRVRTQNRPRRRYIDEAHEDAIRGPHFQVTAPKRANLTSMTGHVLAYLGVLGLTVGTAIVICGHFLGYSDYTPTGWLVTTVAQMMLFLGVINLVSGGIDQTNVDVSNRINTLGEQLLRIEQVTEEALRGPKISASRYMGEEAEVEERERATVGRQQ